MQLVKVKHPNHDNFWLSFGRNKESLPFRTVTLTGVPLVPRYMMAAAPELYWFEMSHGKIRLTNMSSCFCWNGIFCGKSWVNMVPPVPHGRPVGGKTFIILLYHAPHGDLGDPTHPGWSRSRSYFAKRPETLAGWFADRWTWSEARQALPREPSESAPGRRWVRSRLWSTE